jgi:Fe-S-cluster-containing hydrogenase component 2
MIIDRAGLQRLIELLRENHFRVIGPTVREDALVLAEIEGVEGLPAGLTDTQDAATFRLQPRDDRALFGYANGPHSWKRYLNPPQSTLWHAERQDGDLVFEPVPQDPPAYAFFGVRPCDVAAIAIQDRVYLESGFRDPIYGARRERAFIVAVNCTEPGGTCFCASMGTGPRAVRGYDLVLTEIHDRESARHEFLLQSGSIAGATMAAQLPTRPAAPEEVAAVDRMLTEAAAQMGRSLEIDGLPEVLRDAYEHAQWDDVAERCLSCTSCTMVCPTCFCATVEDHTALDGESATRTRRWDSCFTNDFAYVHGGSIRANTRSRYRQWLTHKLGTWEAQFGTPGCVGCGRCITWCPAAIDITAEAAALREPVATGRTRRAVSASQVVRSRKERMLPHPVPGGYRRQRQAAPSGADQLNEGGQEQ